MSNLNEFLVELQCGLFCTQAGTEVFFIGFGDSTFSLGLQCIQLYYREFQHGARLDDTQARCNEAMWSTRIAIKKIMAQVSTLFCICCTTKDSKIGKMNPVAFKQLRVCHHLMNCYVCLNGDQAGSTNTFNITPLLLENYLML
jgi:hypothetical protein